MVKILNQNERGGGFTRLANLFFAMHEVAQF